MIDVSEREIQNDGSKNNDNNKKKKKKKKKKEMEIRKISYFLVWILSHVFLGLRSFSFLRNISKP